MSTEFDNRLVNNYKQDMLKIINRQASILHKLGEELKKEENAKDIVSFTQNSNETNLSSQRLIDLKRCQDYQELLIGEAKKLENFDVVLAVVGTMKAGKSTTINAIVGREILPNRNRPMTALPTLICHNPTKIEPYLTLNPIKLNQHIEAIKLRVDYIPTEITNKDILDLIGFILNGRTFKHAYSGDQAIFSFLCRLNDLVRLTTLINDNIKNFYEINQEPLDDELLLEFPFENYKNFIDLPKIEIAFNFSDEIVSQGRLMLLDTAGPNEAGHEVLVDALNDQLQRSSAVMLVLDYTQLNSQAEADVKEQIEQIPTIKKSRLFALVNKFDQQTANSDDKNSTKQHIFKNLLKDKIELDNIFPVSSHSAYLANRMLNSLKSNSDIPIYEQETWVEDFADIVFGKRAAKFYPVSTIDELLEESQTLLKDSLMPEPIEKVIVKMQQNAPFIALTSALTGVETVFTDLENVLNIRKKFAEKAVMTDEEIKHLKKSIELVKQKKEELDKEVNLLLFNLTEVTDEIIKKADFEKDKQEIKSNLNKFIEETIEDQILRAKGSLKDEEDRYNKWKPKTEKEKKIYLDEVAKLKAELEALKNAKKDGEIIFFDESRKDKFSKRLEQDLAEYFKESIASKLETSLSNYRKKADTEIDKIVEQANELIYDFKNQFNDNELNIKFTRQQSTSFKLEQDNFKIAIASKGKDKVKVSVGGFLNNLGNFVTLGLGGFGKKKIEVTTYSFKQKNILDNSIKVVEEDVFNKFRESLNETNEKIVQDTQKYVSTLIDIVGRVQNEMQKELDNNLGKSLKEKEDYKSMILSLKRQNDEVIEDLQDIKDAIAAADLY